ncbi:hypothetical protein SASPL_127413 [Salvia splendens]|uniref:F-box domain-containing protein n=1 Tax=Salvia splendens TaxID=180675 RepID=A0A8X8XB39_SALSN|nr:F-box/FBD/LRR-repeat protein At1g80470-like [Salvia splendens]KAG6409374.1 hypothetical protein SASPL_127413 [Salvia splendens]
MKEDRMSNLSDDILLLILDKINTFEAVKTSILSHRWKNLWCHLPRLRFLFIFATEYAIHELHLSPLDADTESVEKCVLFAINHGAESLRLLAPTSLKLRLPAAFLTCETLQELELWNPYGSVKLPQRLFLPNLKTFHLETLLVFDDDDISMEPFSGLPELEKLTLIKYSRDGIVIKAPKLRLLEIIDIPKVEEISAPLLTSFIYRGNKAWECEKVNLPMLEQVYVHIYNHRYCVNHNNFIRMSDQLLGNATTYRFEFGTHLQGLEHNDGPFEVKKRGSLLRSVFRCFRE